MSTKRFPVAARRGRPEPIDVARVIGVRRSLLAFAESVERFTMDEARDAVQEVEVDQAGMAALLADLIEMGRLKQEGRYYSLNPQRRAPTVAFWVLLLAACAASLVGGYHAVRVRLLEREFEASKQRIPRWNVELIDLKLDHPSPYPTFRYQLSGRIRNNNRTYTLTGLAVEVTLEDCIKKACEVVRSEVYLLEPLVVPPGEVHDIEVAAYFPSFQQRGKRLQWSHRLLYTRGEEVASFAGLGDGPNRSNDRRS